MEKILFGYLAFTAYVVFILAFGMILEKKTKLGTTTCRKITHIISAFLWVICYYFFGCSIHWVILNGIGALGLFLMSYGNLFKHFNRDDATKNYGLFYFGFSTFIVSIFCLIWPELYLYSGVAYYCLALGDGLAPIMTKLFKSKNVQISPTRSLVGSLTVFFVSLAACFVFYLALGLEIDVLFIFSIAALTTVAEFYGLKGLDNIIIEFMVFGYLVLHHFGLVTPLLEIVILTTPALAMLMIGSKSLDAAGGITSLLLFLAMAFFGDVFETVYTAVYFLVATLIAFITGRIYAKKGGKKEKHMRTGRQVVAVGLVPLALVIAGYFAKNKFFEVCFYLTVAEQFADSMASDIGRLTSGKNINIVGFKPVEKGISGGVSLLGTLVALFSSFLLPLIPFLFGRIGLIAFLLVGAFSFLGVLVDSFLGSMFQGLYLCHECGREVETALHCDKPTEKIKGFKIVDNTAVNLLSGFAVAALGCFLLLI
ncbi:MAG: DUF92 domain-containing protein [Bacilli bacterium]|nr:DUF92 domain-containing protein [Bacilli bacterium]